MGRGFWGKEKKEKLIFKFSWSSLVSGGDILRDGRDCSVGRMVRRLLSWFELDSMRGVLFVVGIEKGLESYRDSKR